MRYLAENLAVIGHGGFAGSSNWMAFASRPATIGPPPVKPSVTVGTLKKVQLIIAPQTMVTLGLPPVPAVMLSVPFPLPVATKFAMYGRLSALPVPPPMVQVDFGGIEQLVKIAAVILAGSGSPDSAEVSPASVESQTIVAKVGYELRWFCNVAPCCGTALSFEMEFRVGGVGFRRGTDILVLAATASAVPRSATKAPTIAATNPITFKSLISSSSVIAGAARASLLCGRDR
jgi:hypothetical protein